MKRGLRTLILTAIVVGLAACAREGEQGAMEQEATPAEMAEGAQAEQLYPNMPAGIVFESERYIAQRLVSEPGSGWAGEHPHTGGQLVVVLEGGTQTYREGGKDTVRTYEPGDVFWVEPTQAHDHAVTGDSRFTRILITLAGTGAMGGVRQVYPNSPAEVIFENDRVVAQRISDAPGQWSGEHSHPGGQLFVVVKGATVTYRAAGEDSVVTYADGDVIEVAATAAHDHAVTGGTGLTGVLITRK